MDPGVLMERALTARATGMGFSDCDCKAIPVASSGTCEEKSGAEQGPLTVKHPCPLPGTCEEELRLSFCPDRASLTTPISQEDTSQGSKRVPPARPAQVSSALQSQVWLFL